MSLAYRIDVPKELLDDFRLFIGDQPEFNRLIEGTESSDAKIKLAFRLWLNNFNNSPPVTDIKYTFENFPNYFIAFEGVMIQTLVMNGIINTRNFLNFNDGGVSFTVNDKGQSYLQWISTFMNKHQSEVSNVKAGINAEEGFAFIPSPEGWNYPYEGDL